MNMLIDNQKVLNDFSKEVKEKKYKKVQYDIWRKLVAGNTSLISFENNNIVFSSKNDLIFFNINDNSFGKYLYNKYYENAPISDTIKKENVNMFNNFSFGPISDGSVKFSPYGLSIRNSEKKWVSYNVHQNQIIETDGFTFDMNNMIYKIPVAVKDVQPGDMILHNGTYVYVLENTDGNIKVVNIFAGDQRTILPSCNMFGFNFVTKIVSILDMAGFGCGTPSANEPFGNILPMLVMSQMFNNDSNSNDFGQIMMMSMIFNGQNPLSNIFTKKNS